MEFVREGSLDNYLRSHKNLIKAPLFIFADNICEGMIYLSREVRKYLLMKVPKYLLILKCHFLKS